MRTPAIFLLVSAAIAAPVAAWSQAGQPPASPDDYVCAFSGDCGDTNAAQPAGEATPAGPGPRLSATRGFAISGSNSAPRAVQPRRAGSAPRRFSFSVAQAPMPIG